MIKQTKNKMFPIFTALFLLVFSLLPPFANANCPPPWQAVVYPGVGTTAYGTVTIGGEPAAQGDYVGAFVGDECRAVQEVVISGGIAYVTLVINGLTPETVSFKIWDADGCKAVDVAFTTQSNPEGKIGMPDLLTIDGDGEPLTSTLSVTPGTQSLSAQNGTFNLNIAATVPFTWAASTGTSDWLHIQGDSSGSEDAVLAVAYDANTGAQRTGVITITSPEVSNSPKTVSITQAAFAPVGDNTVTLIPSANEVVPGGILTAKIKISADNAWAVHAVLKAETDKVELRQSGLYGEFFEPPQRFNIPMAFDIPNGTVTGAQTLQHPAVPKSGEGFFMEGIKFKALPNTFGETRIAVDTILTDRLGNTLPVNVNEAVIFINDGIHGGDGLIEGTITLVDGTPVPNAEVTISLDGHQYTVVTDENGHYTLDNLNGLNEGDVYTIKASKDGFQATGSVDSVIPSANLSMEILNSQLADLNKDGSVTIADFTLMANSYGTSEGEAGYDSRADLNGDQQVNIQDLALLGSHWKV